MVLLFKMFAFLIFVFTVSPLTFARVDTECIAPRDQKANDCLLPLYPEHGKYTVRNDPFAMPGESYPSVILDISCDTGYLIKNTNDNIFCVNGYWSATMPTCDLLGTVDDLLKKNRYITSENGSILSYILQRSCTLSTNDLSVEYRCVSTPGSLEGSQECESFVPSGAVVTPICRSPGYFSLRSLSKMHCRDGMWDYNPICKPACGITTQHRQLEDTSSNHLELPWHAVIYGKWSNPYEQFCGGSLITANKIISTAFCFYRENGELREASFFVVAVNKMYRPYNDPRDRSSQHSDVIDIKIPSDYRGHAGNYENNIAIVIVETPFIFHLSVRPVCLDFDSNLDRTQLTERNSGRTVRWSNAGNNDQSSEVLNVVDFSYTNNEDCENILPTDSGYLTKDKFCTRYHNVSGLLTVNFGSGLVFLESTTQRYYLQGVISFAYVAPKDRTMIIAYTSTIKHEHFIKQYL